MFFLFYITRSSVFDMSAKNRKVNANISSSALSRAECEQISELVVVASEEKNKSRSPLNKSFVWRYFGALHLSANRQFVLLDNDRHYCRLVNVFIMTIG